MKKIENWISFAYIIANRFGGGCGGKKAILSAPAERGGPAPKAF